MSVGRGRAGPWSQYKPPMGTPTNTVPQNVLGNLAGLGTIAAANVGVGVANSMAGLGTGEATVVAQVQSFLAQAIKHWKHWDEDHWTQPFMALVGIVVAYFLVGSMGVGTGWGLGDLARSAIISIQGVKLAVVEYHAAQATVAAGIVKPVEPESEYKAQGSHPWPWQRRREDGTT